MRIGANGAMAAALLLAGCGAQPTPFMSGAQRVEAERDGRRYVVFHTAERVEVIRLGFARPPEHRGIRATMTALVPEVTGCRLVEQGRQSDSGALHGRISCPGPGPGAEGEGA